MSRILKYVMLDILNNKIMLVYTLMLSTFTWSTFMLEDSAAKGVLTVLNIILLAVPLVSVLFATIYVYNSSEFIELLISHPVRRSKVWNSMFSGLSLSLIVAYWLGTGIPLLLFAEIKIAIMMIIAGSLLSVVFVAIAFLSSILTRDKARGIGLAIMLWLYFALLFDGLILFIFFQFADYPIEKLVVMLSALSPIDLCRILVLLQLDVSAMLGYTGAVFQETFGNTRGLFFSGVLMLLWVGLPFYWSLRKFKRKDM